MHLVVLLLMLFDLSCVLNTGIHMWVLTLNMHPHEDPLITSPPHSTEHSLRVATVTATAAHDKENSFVVVV